MSILDRFRFLTTSRRLGLGVLFVGMGVTLLWVHILGGTGRTGLVWPLSRVSTGSTIDPTSGVRLEATLSHPKIIQGEDGRVYLDLNITTPEVTVGRDSMPSDVLVILDRSGSMGEGQKWAYATQAVRSLLERLTPADRIGLISFDSSARLDARLCDATPEHVGRVREALERLRPGASTNLGQSLLLAEANLSGGLKGTRRSRVLVLSDGHANTGIVDAGQLQQIVKRLSERGSIVSTIGMGLGFNETLMASLADYGMGRFSYLENLESLGSILGAELSDSRRVFADASEVLLRVPRGVRLADAAGYPYEHEARQVTIRTGQLLNGSSKGFMLALDVPARELGEHELGPVTLRYRVDGRSLEQQFGSTNPLVVACVAPEKKEEAIASVDETVYRRAWLKNNLGELMKKVGSFVGSGEKSKATRLVEDYKSRLQEASQMAPGLYEQAGRDLRELEAQIDDAFAGPDSPTKQNRTAKQFLDSSQKMQRDGGPTAGR